MITILLILVIVLLLINNINSFTINNRISNRISNRINTLIRKEYNQLSTTTTTTTSAIASASGSIIDNELSRCDKYAINITKKFKWGIIGTIVRYINVCIVHFIMVFLFRILNSLKIIRGELLWKNLFKRENGRPLLTVSNHMSMLDDPGLMGAILPYWRFKPDQVRWSLCTEDMFFVGGGKLEPAFLGGNVLPLDRTGSLEQPLFKLFCDKLSQGSWCHVFAEGRIWQSWRFAGDETRLGPFKIGVGKLIAHSKRSPIVVPMYHKGMDNIIPEKQLSDKNSKKAAKPISLIPRIGNKVEVYYGESFDFTEKIDEFKKKYPGMLDKWSSTSETIQLYTEIAEECRQRVKKLAREAFGQYNSNLQAPKFEG